MPATWFYIVGGIVIGMLVFTIAYHLISVSIIQAQKQAALFSFNRFHSDLKSVCLGEINNSMVLKLKIPNVVRIIYTTNDTMKSLPRVVYRIKDEETNKGRNLCMEFRDEVNVTLRCKKITCNVTQPYMGPLPESMDIKIFVKRILGQAPVKEYYLTLTKTKGDEVEVTIGEELV